MKIRTCANRHFLFIISAQFHLRLYSDKKKIIPHSKVIGYVNTWEGNFCDASKQTSELKTQVKNTFTGSLTKLVRLKTCLLFRTVALAYSFKELRKNCTKSDSLPTDARCVGVHWRTRQCQDCLRQIATHFNNYLDVKCETVGPTKKW